MKKQNFIQFVEHASDLGERLPDKTMQKYYKLNKSYKTYYFKRAPRGYGKRAWKRERRKLKFKKLLRARLGVILAVLIAVGVFTLFYISNSVSEALRGYKAVGGEFFILFLPVALILARDLLHDFIDLFK